MRLRVVSVTAVLLLNVASLRAQNQVPVADEKFAPTVSDEGSAPSSPPKGMVWIPGGEFSMGAKVNGGGSCEMPMASNDAGPVHRVRVDGSWMDATAVTNEQFEEFVKATGYVDRKSTRLNSSHVSIS